MARFTITTPIFYVNARPHIGHAYTVVAADVLARLHRLRGDDPTSPTGPRGAGVFFLTGTDEHGAKIAEAAEAARKSPQDFADENAETFKSAWKVLDIQYDDFIRTTEPRHEAGVNAALRTLHDHGFLYQKSYRGLYCTGCERFVTQKDLDLEGKCLDHQRLPVDVEEKNWFFKLAEFLPRVKKAVGSGELRVEPKERANEVLGLFAQGLEDFSISRSRERVPWGIPLPFDETQTCYVWVDALLNYVTALGYGSDDTSKLKKHWPADIQIIGQDILKFHAVYWPALLLALDLPLPKSLSVHGFFTVNGQKIGKSLGNAIDPLALVQRYGVDATRYLLLSQFPFGASGDVNVNRFDEQYDAILANTIGNLVSRTITLLQKFSDGNIPDAPLDTAVRAGVILNEVKDLSSVASALDALVREPVRLAQELNQYADRTAPWKEKGVAKRATALRTLAEGVVRLALLAEPLLPSTSASIQKAFGVTGRREPSTDIRARLPREASAKWGLPRVAPKERSGVHPTDPPVLFPRAGRAGERATGR